MFTVRCRLIYDVDIHDGHKYTLLDADKKPKIKNKEKKYTYIVYIAKRDEATKDEIEKAKEF